MIRSFLLIGLFAAVPAMATFDIPSPKRLERQFQERARARYDIGLESVRQLPQGSREVGTHIVFNSKADAFRYMKATEAEMGESFGAQKFKMIENHPDAAKLQAYVDEIWGAFQALFPSYVDGLEPPHVLVVDTEQTTAFVPSHEGSSLHIVVMMTGMIEKAGGVDQLDKITGNLAHEVAHSVFSHGTPAQEKRIERFYLQDKNLMGFQSGLSLVEQKTNSQINNLMNAYVSGIQNVGEITRDDLLDLPAPAYAAPLLQRVWAKFREQAAASQVRACREEAAAHDQWSRMMRFSPYDFKYEVVPSASPRLKVSSESLVANGQQCFAKQNEFTKIYAEALGVSPFALEQDPEFQKMKATVAAAEDSFTGLRNLVRAQRTKMKRIERQKFFGNLGFYTTEQHADDASAIVHAYLGRNAGAFGELLKVSMSRSNPKYPEVCAAKLKQGEIPDLGSYLIAHHSNCYRLWNFARMKERMAGMTKEQIKSFAQEFQAKSIR